LETLDEVVVVGYGTQKKVVALLIALGLTSVFASEANATKAEKNATKAEKKVKKAKKEANATKAEKNATK
jgi:3-hydroxyacyl-CoA dehydrogenase